MIEREANLLLVWLLGESNGGTQALVDAEPFWYPPGDDGLVALIDYLRGRALCTTPSSAPLERSARSPHTEWLRLSGSLQTGIAPA